MYISHFNSCIFRLFCLQYSLLWIIHGENNNCQETFPREFDFIIVGGGTAGLTVAGRLSELPHVTVCVVEAGISDQKQPIATAIETPRFWGTLSPGEITWNYTTVPQRNINGRVLFTGMGKTLGGSSSHNSMGYFRGFKADYDNWKRIGASGWSYADVLPWFLKSEDNRIPELKNSSLHSTCGPITVTQSNFTPETPLFKLLSRTADVMSIPKGECNRQEPFGLCITQWTIESGKRETTSTAFLRQNIGRNNLFVITEAMVTKILISRGQKRAYGISFIKNGRTRFLRARREVISSAGSYETPKLLQLSGIGPKSVLRNLKIPSIRFLPVGKNLHDHVVFPFEILADIDTITLKTLTSKDVLAEYIFRRTGLIAEPEGTMNIFFDLTSNRNFNRPEAQVLFFGQRFLDLFPRESVQNADLPENIMIKRRNGTGVGLILLNPKSRGTLLPKSKNAGDLPLINPRIFDDPEDIENMIKGIRKIQQLVNSRPMQEVHAEISLLLPVPSTCLKYKNDSDKQWGCIIKQTVIPGLHPVSTCKMGARIDSTTVVDTKLRVKGVKGLRVADASIIPVIPSANIMAPVIMIGERAADFIKQDLYKNRRY